MGAVTYIKSSLYREFVISSFFIRVYEFINLMRPEISSTYREFVLSDARIIERLLTGYHLAENNAIDSSKTGHDAKNIFFKMVVRSSTTIFILINI